MDDIAPPGQFDPELIINFKNKSIRAIDRSGSAGSSAVSSTRSAVMVRNLRNRVDYRVKSVMHGNQRACEEFTMQKLYGLIPGTLSPHTLLGVNFDKRPEFANIRKKADYASNKKNNIPDYYIASPYPDPESGSFDDLGRFLINTARFALDERYRSANPDDIDADEPGDYSPESVYRKLRAKVLAIKGNSAEDKLQKRNLLIDIYNLLPNVIRHKFDVTYYNSLWLGNWDFLNFSMYNTGFLFDSEGETIEEMFHAMIVDFGNCGPTGFGGMYKEESLIRANTPAKVKPQQDLKDADYDPDLNQYQHISRHDAALFKNKPSTITALHTLPRKLPFSQLFAAQLSNQFAHYEHVKPGGKTPSFVDAALESAYSLLLVSDEAIDAVVNKCYLVGPGKAIPFLELSPATFNKMFPPQAIQDAIKFLKLSDNPATNPVSIE